MDFHDHPFWWSITMAVVVWYSTITIYIAFKGAFDIREMLGNLRQRDKRTDKHTP